MIHPSMKCPTSNLHDCGLCHNNAHQRGTSPLIPTGPERKLFSGSYRANLQTVPVLDVLYECGRGEHHTTTRAGKILPFPQLKVPVRMTWRALVTVLAHPVGSQRIAVIGAAIFVRAAWMTPFGYTFRVGSSGQLIQALTQIPTMHSHYLTDRQNSHGNDPHASCQSGHQILRLVGFRVYSNGSALGRVPEQAFVRTSPRCGHRASALLAAGFLRPESVFSC
jgi:hypothetical protein